MALVFTGVAAGYGLSVARAEDESSTIYACVNKWNGATRIVDEDDDCSRSEFSESWGQVGPAGPPGAPAGMTLVSERVEIKYAFGRSFRILCPNGSWAVDGGFDFDQEYGDEIEVLFNEAVSVPHDSALPTAWEVDLDVDGAMVTAQGGIWVLCADSGR